MLNIVHGDSVLKKTSIFKWTERFHGGRENGNDHAMKDAL